MVYACWTANARDAEDGSNVFAAGEGRTRIGERLTPLPVTLLSDPAWPGEETLPFVASTSSEDGTSFSFDLGLDVGQVRWLDEGVLHDLARNRGHGAATGLPATPAAHNVIMDAGGTATLEEMVARTERGLLLTCFWYIREVDPERLLLTGLTRDGVYLVEHGEVVGGGQQLPLERVADRAARARHRGRGQRPRPLPGVERLHHQDGDAAAARARLQLLDGQPGVLRREAPTGAARRSGAFRRLRSGWSVSISSASKVTTPRRIGAHEGVGGLPQRTRAGGVGHLPGEVDDLTHPAHEVAGGEVGLVEHAGQRAARRPTRTRPRRSRSRAPPSA